MVSSIIGLLFGIKSTTIGKWVVVDKPEESTTVMINVSNPLRALYDVKVIVRRVSIPLLCNELVTTIPGLVCARLSIKPDALVSWSFTVIVNCVAAPAQL